MTGWGDEPKVNIGVQVLCADTEERAQRIAASRNLGRLYSVTNRAKGIPTVEEALDYTYQMNELAFIRQYSQVCADGNPQQVKEKLEKISEIYETADLSVVTICHEFADRVRSYELVAKVCGLEKAEGTQ